MSLRQQVLRGGTFLVLRQGLGLGISIGGVLVLTRVLGPALYGQYAVAIGIYAYLLTLSQFGINVYLIRKEGDVSDEDFQIGATLLFIFGLAGSVLGAAVSSLVVDWTGIPEVHDLLLVLALGLPLNLVSLAALAKLERNLRYEWVAIGELGALALSYCTSIGFALNGWGAWAPVMGWWVQQIVTFLYMFRRSGLSLAFRWDKTKAFGMVRYGISYSSSTWVWQLRDLVNPLIVSRFLGAEAVGVIALTIKLVDSLSFVKNATWRLSLSVLAKLQNDGKRIASAISEGIVLQLLSVGIFLVLFAAAGPWIIPNLFGASWLPVLGVFPFIALSYLTNAGFNLHASALYVIGKNWNVTIFHCIHVLLFAGGASLLVGSWGVQGYGLAELCALPSYLIIEYAVRKLLGPVEYRYAWKVWVPLGIAVFALKFGWWLLLAAPFAFVPSEVRRQVKNLYAILRARTTGPTVEGGI